MAGLWGVKLAPGLAHAKWGRLPAMPGVCLFVVCGRALHRCTKHTVQRPVQGREEAYSLEQVDGKEQQEEAISSQQEAHHGTGSEGCTGTGPSQWQAQECRFQSNKGRRRQRMSQSAAEWSSTAL